VGVIRIGSQEREKTETHSATSRSFYQPSGAALAEGSSGQLEATLGTTHTSVCGGSLMTSLPSDVVLREVQAEDLPLFFDHQLDPDANYMAAFTAKDPTDRLAFMAHWANILGDATTTNRTILYEGQVAGSVSSYEETAGHPEVTYWLGKPYWGKGIATAALRALLQQVTARPIYARVAQDNRGSLRVLEKCGFTIVGEDTGFANARGQETAEWLLQLS
jgi:RimJ/RimL family protein N-acetyltransferase